MTEAFNAFSLAYQQGNNRLLAINPESDDLGHVADTAFLALQDTAFGQQLMASDELRTGLAMLELDLGNWLERVLPKLKSPASEKLGLMDEDGQEPVRRFHYWGRLGQILYHFREHGRSLNTSWERLQREALQKKIARLIKDVETLATDPVVQAVYQSHAMNHAKQAVRSLHAFSKDLVQTPLDIPPGMANPFQDGNSLIRRQFILLINLMAFELFGCISPAILERMLEIKSSTAEAMGLRAWPLAEQGEPLSGESRSRMLRAAISDDLELARYRAKQLCWQTRPIIDYFYKHPEARREIADLRERYF